jgi:hypothetical protein
VLGAVTEGSIQFKLLESPPPPALISFSPAAPAPAPTLSALLELGLRGFCSLLLLLLLLSVLAAYNRISDGRHVVKVRVRVRVHVGARVETNKGCGVKPRVLWRLLKQLIQRNEAITHDGNNDEERWCWRWRVLVVVVVIVVVILVMIRYS